MSKTVYFFANDANIDLDRDGLVSAMGLQNVDHLVLLNGVNRLAFTETGMPETAEYIPPMTLPSLTNKFVVVEQAGHFSTTYAAESISELIDLRKKMDQYRHTRGRF